MIQMLSLNTLTLSPDNVRKTPPTQNEQQELMASILAHGLLENLIVQKRGTATYDVIAGGRRLLALKTLAERGDLAADHLVACKIHEGQSKEISLAENIVRARMHPLDEFDAFAAMAAEGYAAADIAQRFGVTARVVEQRLRLAHVHPDILAAYRSEAITLEIVMAFAASDDQGRQKAVWSDIQNQYITPQRVRNALYTEGCTGSHHLARFVGEAAYRAAGGQMTIDLFAEDADDAALWEDGALVKKLALEKLEAAALELQKAEGWGWFHCALNRDWQTIHSMGYLPSVGEDGETFDPNEHHRAGFHLYIDYNGELGCERGLLRPEDQPANPVPVASPEGPAEETISYSQSLSEDLGRQRLALTQHAIAQNFDMAFDLMLLTMLGSLTYKGYHYYITYRGDPTLSREDRAALGLECDLASLGIDLSFLDLKTPAALSHLATMTTQDKQRLFAACVAQHVQGGLGCEVLGHIGAELQIDVAAQWRPDLSVFKRLRKDAAFAIAGDVLGPERVAQNSTLKKGELAAVLADIFAGKQQGTLSAQTIERATRWLPEGMGFEWDAESSVRSDDEDLPAAFQIVA